MIVRTAKRLFSRHGSKRVTIEELSREAGVSKVTFYKHFENKVDLVTTIRDEWMDEGFRKFDEINALDISFPEKIDLMTEWKVKVARRVNADFILELVSSDDTKERFKRGYLGNIKAAQQKGEIRADIDPELYWMVIEKLGELVKDGSWKRVCPDAGQYQKQLRTLLFYGLLVRKEGGSQ